MWQCLCLLNAKKFFIVDFRLSLLLLLLCLLLSSEIKYVILVDTIVSAPFKEGPQHAHLHAIGNLIVSSWIRRIGKMEELVAAVNLSLQMEQVSSLDLYLNLIVTSDLLKPQTHTHTCDE